MPRAKQTETSASTAQAQQDAVADGIENFELPRSVVMKLARASQVPENTKFSKDVILAIVKASTVFINYLAATAHEVASSKQHKSISATDVLKALELVEFGDIAKDIQGELQVYRDLQKADKKKGAKGKARDTSDSTPAAPKPKGKAKATTADEHQPLPTIHIPKPSGQLATEPPSELDADDQEPPEDVDEDTEMLDQDEDGPDDVDDDIEDEDEEPELEDTMVLDEEDQRRDARRLDGDGGDED